MRMNTTLVINSKGGSGKTTIATNLASYFAANGVPTTVMDYDPQGSSMNWLRLRNQTGTRLHGANAAPQKSGRIRGVEMFVPADAEHPAGGGGEPGPQLDAGVSAARAVSQFAQPAVPDAHRRFGRVRQSRGGGNRNFRVAPLGSGRRARGIHA